METPTLGLRRQVQRARYRYVWVIAVGAGLGANALIALALWATAPRPPATPTVTVMPAPVMSAGAAAVVVAVPPVMAPVIVVVPPAPPAAAAFSDLGPCPAPHTARPSGRLTQPSSDHTPIVGVAAAPTDSRWVSAWTDDHLFVSRDGGESWDRVLDGPGAMIDASFDCHGRVLVLRDGLGLGVRDGAREAWRMVPGIAVVRQADRDERYAARVVGGGRAIAVVGARPEELDHAHAAISDDGGASWWHADLDWYEGARLAAAWHGTALRVVVPWTDCMSEGTRLVTVTAAGVRSEEIDEATSQLALDGGAIHGVSWQCPGTPSSGGMCTWRPRGGWSAMAVPAGAASDDEAGQLVDGPTDAVVIGERIYTIVAHQLARGRTWSVDWRLLGTDRAGRAWGTDAHGALINR